MRTNARKDAIARGISNYWTGAPCRYGHLAPRTTSNGECQECARLRANAKYRDDSQTQIEIVKRYQNKHPERVRHSKRLTYEKNVGYYLAKAARQRESRDPEIFRSYMAAWHAANPGANAAYCSRRHAAILRRTPAWADLTAIAAFYRGRPEGYEVDHIIPLRGRLVSGLHVLNNLQYLPKLENQRKKNKFNLEEFNDDPNYK